MSKTKTKDRPIALLHSCFILGSFLWSQGDGCLQEIEDAEWGDNGTYVSLLNTFNLAISSQMSSNMSKALVLIKNKGHGKLDFF